MYNNRSSAVAMMIVAGGLAVAVPARAHAAETSGVNEDLVKSTARCDKKIGNIAPCVKTKAGGLAPCVKTKADDLALRAKPKTAVIVPCIKNKGAVVAPAI